MARARSTILPAPKSFRDVLDQVEPRPPDDAGRGEKKNYAENLSNRIAVLFAGSLRKEFPGILPNEDGSGRETKVASGKTKKGKKTDVRFSTHDTGLELLISVKTLSFRDTKKDPTTQAIVLGRYTKNMVRNDHELRAEAMDVHERFPYAVLVGVLFLPYRACDDGLEDKSSFAHAIMTLRPRTGRELPTDPQQLFERLFIGLYEHEGVRRGTVSFFDVNTNPPRRGRPAKGLLSYDEFIADVVKAYGIRNRRYMEWADEEAAGVGHLLERAVSSEDRTDGDDDGDAGADD